MWKIDKIIPLTTCNPIVWWKCGECGKRQDTDNEARAPEKCGCGSAPVPILITPDEVPPAVIRDLVGGYYSVSLMFPYFGWQYSEFLDVSYALTSLFAYELDKGYVPLVVSIEGVPVGEVCRIVCKELKEE